MTSLVYGGSGHVLPEYVRQFNMLYPARWPYLSELGLPGGGQTYMYSWAPAHYFKDWTPFNLLLINNTSVDQVTTTFGDFTTAPDGTTDTARKLVEVASDSQHSAVAGTHVLSQNDIHGNAQYGKLRLAGVFKYAGRRIVLAITVAPNMTAGGDLSYGCKAVFDLQNGQIAVDNAAFGSMTTPWTILPAAIRPVGNGWYLCYVEAIVATDAAFGVSADAIFGKVSLDNGTGTMVERSSYIGDGLSGVYGWRTNLIPSRTWDLQETVFFDDFDDPTMANIDLANSRVEGFDWYINNQFPIFDAVLADGTGVNDGNPNTDPALLSVTDSVLQGEHPYALFLATCASMWNTPPMAETDRGYTTEYVGRGWLLPALFECKAKWGLPDTGTMWTVGLESLMGGGNSDLTSSIPGREMDWFEGYGGAHPLFHAHYYEPGPHVWPITGAGQVAQANNFTSPIDTWQAYPPGEYGMNQSVERLGIFYTSLNGVNRNNPPESSPAWWGTYVPDNLGVISPHNDWTVFHTYSSLTFPSTAEEPGQNYCFIDGRLASVPLVYGPGLPVNTLHQSDGQEYPLLLGCGGGVGHPIFVDWVRVTK